MGFFEGRSPGQVLAPHPPESLKGRSPVGFPRWLPDRAEALTVRRSADSELASLFQAIGGFMDRSP